MQLADRVSTPKAVDAAKRQVRLMTNSNARFLGRQVLFTALPVALAAIAILIRLALGSRLVGYPFLTFFPAILLSTYFGGRRAGVICAILSTLSAWYFLIEPVRSFYLTWPSGPIALAIFTVIAATIVLVIDSMNRANERATASERALARLNSELEDRVASRTAALEDANKELVFHAERTAAAEEKARQLQRLDAVGQLTGGIAHDFNNMLSIIMGNLALAARRLQNGDTDVAKYIDNANDGAERAAALTRRLLAFARRQPLEPVITDVGKLVANLSEMLRRTLGESVAIESVLAGGIWFTEVDPGQLENAIVNLAVNARDAMPRGGKLTIETQNAHLDDAYAAAQADVRPGQYVVVAVSDTGSGMTPDVAARAFEPFFTTKDVDKGTGLGLSQIYGFVKQSGGHAKIYSEPGQGTTIRLYLPRYHGAHAVTASHPAVTSAPAGSRNEVILVVEDDPGVRATSVETLVELGYTVVEASNGEDALARLEKEPVALLFTDVVMPGMSGRELCDQACQRLPGLKTLYTTGYTRNSIVHGGILDPGVDLIQKPFTADQLARKIRAAIDR